MRNVIVLLIFLVGSSLCLQAQYKTIVYDYERNYFNDGAPLPAESFMLFNTNIKPDVQYVEVEIFKTGKHNKPLYKTFWKRSYNNTGEKLDLPINYKLRGGEDYDFELTTYRSTPDTEKENLYKSICNATDAYLDAIISADRKSLNISKSSDAIVSDLSSIVKDGMQFYDNRIDYNFPGFSDIVKLKADQLSQANLKKARFNVSRDQYKKKRDARQAYAQQSRDELKKAVYVEVEQIINTDTFVLDDIVQVYNYPVEESTNLLSVNAGYGAILFDFDQDDLSYDSAPYVGLSFPLGRSAFAGSFLSNASLSAGIFLTNVEDESGTEYTGPIVKRPIYLGLGYKAFHFIRFNIGTTILEKDNGGDRFDLNTDNFKIRPFIGLSAEFNIWVGLGNKKFN